jgi:protein ImuB
VRAGLPLSEARALLPRAVFLPINEPADLDALRQLALECQRFSPLVGLEDAPQPEVLLSNVDGCTHLWGGEAQYLKHVRGYWRAQGYDIQLALADSVGAAWALAHTAPYSLAKPGEAASILPRLPVESLRLPPIVLERLQTLGLDNVGDVLALPRDSLAARFGVLLPRRLDQILGMAPESFVPERLVQPLCTVRDWEVSIDDRLSLVLLCRQMLGELIEMADRHSMGLQELEGELQTEGGPVTLAIRLVEPTSDIGHLERLLDLQLERHSWKGGVTSARWTAIRIGPIEEVQGRWFEDEFEAEKSRALAALVDRLSSRLDASAVVRVEAVPDAQPEFVAKLVPWANKEARNTESFLLPPELSRGRPLRLLARPQSIEVSSIVPDGPPIHLLCGGRGRPVIRAWGPERIATGWWRGADVERDYYRAECNDGAHLWIYCDRHSDRWFLHGFFD